MRGQQIVNFFCVKTRKEYERCYAEIIRFSTDDVLTVSQGSKDDIGGFKNDWFNVEQ